MRVLSSPVVARSPRLSVLVPFFRDDPIDTLLAVAQQADARVEIIAWDDGSDDPELTARLERTLGTLDADVRVVTGIPNQGRSGARNALVARARAAWVLFLDADMRPGDQRFLERYLSCIEEGSAEVVFGGFTVEATGPRETALHRALSDRSDCLDARTRRREGAKLVASSNLCVRRDVLATEDFDGDFSGWGWEDSEWAARVARRFCIIHIDNPAVHLGLETDATLLERFATSGPNYLRFARAHPDLAQGFPLFRHAMRLSRLPGQAALRPVLRRLVTSKALPMRLRVGALKFWRASHYADALGEAW